ncbi:MAG: cell division protein ZapA [Chitinophagaceae bacterium]|nr:cell division protein ZapA [Chitinophagaceae bacterium]
MNEPLLTITAQIAHRSYRIKIKPEDEEAVRSTLRLIQEKISEFQKQFAGKDMQDFLAMALLWFAAGRNTENLQPQHNDWLVPELQKIENMIDECLHNQVEK